MIVLGCGPLENVSIVALQVDSNNAFGVTKLLCGDYSYKSGVMCVTTVNLCSIDCVRRAVPLLGMSLSKRRPHPLAHRFPSNF